MTTPDDGKTWLSRQEAAGRARVHVRTLDRWLADGLLTRYTTGTGMVRVDADELDAFLAPAPAQSA